MFKTLVAFRSSCEWNPLPWKQTELRASLLEIKHAKYFVLWFHESHVNVYRLRSRFYCVLCWMKGQTHQNCLYKYIFAQSASHLSVLCSSLNFNTSGHFFLFARLSISGNTGVTQTCKVLRVRKKKIILTINRIPRTDKPTMKKIFDAGITAVIKILLYCWEVSSVMTWINTHGLIPLQNC